MKGEPRRNHTLSRRLYEALLAAYPRGFRESHGREMADIFEDEYSEQIERRGRAAGLLVSWAWALSDLSCGALAERSDVLVRPLRSPSARMVGLGSLSALLGGALMIVVGFLTAYEMVVLAGHPDASSRLQAMIELFRSGGTLLLSGGLAGLIFLVTLGARASGSGEANMTNAAHDSSSGPGSARIGAVGLSSLSHAQKSALAGLALTVVAAAASAFSVTRVLAGEDYLGIFWAWWSLIFATALLGIAVRRSGVLGRWKRFPLILSLLMVVLPFVCFGTTLLVQAMIPESDGLPFWFGIFVGFGLHHVLAGFLWMVLGILLLAKRTGRVPKAA